RCPNRSILSSTASEDTLASAAWSTNIAWSHDLDEVFGTHKVTARYFPGPPEISAVLTGRLATCPSRIFTLIASMNTTAYTSLPAAGPASPPVPHHPARP